MAGGPKAHPPRLAFPYETAILHLDAILEEMCPCITTSPPESCTLVALEYSPEPTAQRAKISDELFNSIPVDEARGPKWESCDFTTLTEAQASALTIAIHSAWIGPIASTLSEKFKAKLNEEAGRYLDIENGIAKDEAQLRFGCEFAIESLIRHNMLVRLELVA